MHSILIYMDGIAQDCSNSTANALELLQPCTKPSIGYAKLFIRWGEVLKRRPMHKVKCSPNVYHSVPTWYNVEATDHWFTQWLSFLESYTVTSRERHGILIHRYERGIHRWHYSDIIMSAMSFQITGVSIVCWTVCSGADKKNIKHRWQVVQRASNADSVSIWWRHHGYEFLSQR